MRELLGQSGETRGEKSNKVEAAWRIPIGQRHKELGSWKMCYGNEKKGGIERGRSVNKKLRAPNNLLYIFFHPSFPESWREFVKGIFTGDVSSFLFFAHETQENGEFQTCLCEAFTL